MFAVIRLVAGILARGKKPPEQPSERPKTPLDEDMGDESVFLVETFLNDGQEDDEGAEEEEGLEPENPEDGDLEDEEEDFF